MRPWTLLRAARAPAQGDHLTEQLPQDGLGADHEPVHRTLRLLEGEGLVHPTSTQHPGAGPDPRLSHLTPSGTAELHKEASALHELGEMVEAFLSAHPTAPSRPRTTRPLGERCHASGKPTSTAEMGARAGGRKGAMVAMRAAGDTFEEIGAHFELSGERVRQVLIEDGPRVSNEQALKARHAREREAAEARREEVLAAWRAGGSWIAIADRLRIRRPLVREIVDAAPISDVAARRRALTERPDFRPPSFSESQLIDALQIAASRLGRVPNQLEYSKIAREAGLPSLSTMRNRFGAWNDALGAAKLPPRPASRSYELRWTEEKCLRALRGVVAELGELPPVNDYERLARGRPDLPSQATIRTRLGRWNDLALRLALERETTDD